MTERGAIIFETDLLRCRQCRVGPLAYLKQDIFIGRSLDLYGDFCPDETDFLAQLARPGDTVLDVGANVGVHTILFSRLVGDEGRVVSWEPQPVIFSILAMNVMLNSRLNVDLRREAVGANVGEVVVPQTDYRAAGNFGGVAMQKNGDGAPTPLTRIDALALDSCALIKIDIEGMELDAIRGAAATIETHRPALYLENNREEYSAGLLRALFEKNYRVFWHLPYLYSGKNYFSRPDNVFGNILSANIFALPQERNTKVSNLKEVESPDEWWR